MVKIVLFIYNLLFPLAFLLHFPFFITKLVRRGNFRAGFWERFGTYSALKKKQLKACNNPVWIHAVSVGETVAALSFIQEWCRLEPQLTFVLSTTTSTGQQIARNRSLKDVITIYFPIDFYFCVKSALSMVNPSFLVIFEVEIWPNIIVTASKMNIPIALVNTRMSDRSASGYQRFRWIFKPIFEKFSLICTQGEEDAWKIKSIIGDNPIVKVCNTIKFDQLPIISIQDGGRIVDKLFSDEKRIVFTAASTHQGEEILVARVVKHLLKDFPGLFHILIPRHVERTPDIEKVLKNTGLDYIRLTDLRKSASNERLSASKPIEEYKIRVLLVDTTGEMMNFLAQSDIVFVGNSMAGNSGGHNIVEPALLSKPVIFGSGMDNFRQVAQIFKDNDACVEVNDEQGLTQSLRMLMKDAKERERLGRKSFETVEKNRGATSRTIRYLQTLEANQNNSQVVQLNGSQSDF